MAYSSNETSPSKLWYVWQRTRGLLKNLTDDSYKRDARVMALNGGMTAACLTGLYILPAALGLIAALPAVAVGGYTALVAYRKGQLLNSSPVTIRHMRAAEEKWQEKMRRGSFMKRVGVALKKGLGKSALPFVKVAKWAGFVTGGFAAGISTVAALQATGVVALPASFMSALGASVTSAGAAVGLAAGAAMTTAAVLMVATVPAAIAIGLLCRKAEGYIDEKLVHADIGYTPTPRFKSKLEETASPANDFGKAAEPRVKSEAELAREQELREKRAAVRAAAQRK